MLDPHDSEAKWEDELCEFYALMGWTMGYAWSTCHGYLYSIRRAHRLQRINLDIRDAAMPLLSLLRKGLKRAYGAPKRKIAATTTLLMEVYRNGNLDLSTWNGLVTWTAILVGFFFLLRSSEYLRKSEGVDDQKCIRVRNALFPKEGGQADVDDDDECDEVLLFQEYSKNDFMGQGTDNNIHKNNAEPALCIPTHFNLLRRMSTAMGKGFFDENKFLRVFHDPKLRPETFE